MLVAIALGCSSSPSAAVDLRNTSYDCSTSIVAAGTDCTGAAWRHPNLRFVGGSADLCWDEAVPADALSTPETKVVDAYDLDDEHQVAIVSDSGGGIGICMYAYFFNRGHCELAYAFGDRSRSQQPQLTPEGTVAFAYRERGLEDASCCPQVQRRIEWYPER